MEMLLVYWWSIFDQVGELTTKISGVGFFLLIILAVLSGVLRLYSHDFNNEEALSLSKKAFFYIKPLGIFLSILIVLKALTPTKEMVVLIIASPKIVEVSKDISKSVSESKKIESINNILDNSLKYLETQSKNLNKDK